MAFSFTKFIKGISIRQENTTTPNGIDIVPGGSANTTTTITSTQTTNRTITIPDASFTVIGASTTDVLSNKTIDADLNTITNIDNNEIKAAAGIDATKLADGSVSNTELQYINTVTSNVQDQLDGKQSAGSYITALTGDVVAAGPGSATATIQPDSITTAMILNNQVTTAKIADLNVTRAKIQDNAVNTTQLEDGAVTNLKVASGIDAAKIADGSVSNTEFQYLATVTSDVQTQINSKEPAITTLTVNKGGTGSNTLTLNNVLLGNGTSALQTIAPGTNGNVLTSDGTTWLSSPPSIVAPTTQLLTSGSGTYTTPANVKYLRVRMVGAGGGGAGSGAFATPGTNAADGTNTTFGSSLLTAGGGRGGLSDGTGGDGGVSIVNAPAYGFNPPGNFGGTGSLAAITTGALPGGMGAASFWGGSGSAGSGGSGVVATAGLVNTGAGGGGASPTSAALSYAAGGGGSGGYIDAIIPNPSATYSYSIGVEGAAGTAGTGGNAGAAGGSGFIIVEEYY